MLSRKKRAVTQLRKSEMLQKTVDIYMLAHQRYLLIQTTTKKCVNLYFTYSFTDPYIFSRK